MGGKEKDLKGRKGIIVLLSMDSCIAINRN